MRANPSRPVVRGVDFALYTQEGGADEVYFIPDSDDEGYCNRWKFKGGEDEFVPESEPVEPEAAGVQGNFTPTAPGVDGDRQDCNQRRPLGLMFKGWQRALFPNDNLVADQTVAAAKMNHDSKSETHKECTKKVISNVEVQLPQVKPEIKEEVSISDAETDDEGVGEEEDERALQNWSACFCLLTNRLGSVDVGDVRITISVHGTLN